MKRLLLIFALLFTADICIAAVPVDLARIVLKDQIAQLEARDDFVMCVSIDGKDADEETLKSLHDAHHNVVPGSECVWVLDVSKGSYQKSSGRKAMLVNVFDYQKRGQVEFEARYHGKWATMKTLKVSKQASGWKVVRTLKHMMADAEQMLPSDALKTTRA